MTVMQFFFPVHWPFARAIYPGKQNEAVCNLSHQQSVFREVLEFAQKGQINSISIFQSLTLLD